MHRASEHQWQHLGAAVGRLVAARLPSQADVEDVVQEVLIRVWRNGADARDGARFKAWLHRVAMNAAADQLRMRQRHPLTRGLAARMPERQAAPEPDGRNHAKDLLAAVLEPFVSELPAPYREVIRLSELEQLPHAVIAARLGLSVSGVKSRVQRGRQQLRGLLERCCEIALDARGTPVSCAPRPGAQIPGGCCPAVLVEDPRGHRRGSATSVRAASPGRGAGAVRRRR